jgi:hypothetical protein
MLAVLTPMLPHFRHVEAVGCLGIVSPPIELIYIPTEISAPIMNPHCPNMNAPANGVNTIATSVKVAFSIIKSISLSTFIAKFDRC